MAVLGHEDIYIMLHRSQDCFLPLGGYFEKLKGSSLISAWQPGPATLLCWSLGATGPVCDLRERRLGWRSEGEELHWGKSWAP